MAAKENRLKAFAGMTQAQFLGKPIITSDANARDLRPSAMQSHVQLPRESFLESNHGARFEAVFSAKGATVFDTHQGNEVVASYDNFGRGSSTLVVRKTHRRQGIGSELMYEWRTRNPSADLAETRTKKSQALQVKVWQRIQNEIHSLRAKEFIEKSTSPASAVSPRV